MKPIFETFFGNTNITKSKTTDRLIVMDNIIDGVLNGVESSRIKTIEIDWTEYGAINDETYVPNLKIEFYDTESITVTPPEKEEE